MGKIWEFLFLNAAVPKTMSALRLILFGFGTFTYSETFFYFPDFLFKKVFFSTLEKLTSLNISAEGTKHIKIVCNS